MTNTRRRHRRIALGRPRLPPPRHPARRSPSIPIRYLLYIMDAVPIVCAALFVARTTGPFLGTLGRSNDTHRGGRSAPMMPGGRQSGLPQSGRHRRRGRRARRRIIARDTPTRRWRPGISPRRHLCRRPRVTTTPSPRFVRGRFRVALPRRQHLRTASIPPTVVADTQGRSQQRRQECGMSY